MIRFQIPTREAKGLGPREGPGGRRAGRPALGGLLRGGLGGVQPGSSFGVPHGEGAMAAGGQGTPSSPAPCCVPWVSHGASDVLSSARPGL